MFTKKISRESKQIENYAFSIVTQCVDGRELRNRVREQYPDISEQRVISRSAKAIRRARGKNLINW